MLFYRNRFAILLISLILGGLTLAGCEGAGADRKVDNEAAITPAAVLTPEYTPTPSPSNTPSPSFTPTPTNTSTPTFTPTPTQIPANEMFNESYFAIIKERLQSYHDDEAGVDLRESAFASYETAFNADDYMTYRIDVEKVIFAFSENRLTGAEHPAFEYECELSEAIKFMNFTPNGEVNYKPAIREGLDPNGLMVAFTYDDGPNYKIEKELIDVFMEHDGRCTFFVQGSTLKYGGSAAESLKNMVSNGFEVESHCYDHSYFRNEDFDKESYWKNINKTNLLIADITGFCPRWVRMPGGMYRKYMKDYCPLPIAHWTTSSGDSGSRTLKAGETWDDLYARKEKESITNILKKVYNINGDEYTVKNSAGLDGQFILMHSTRPEQPEVMRFVLDKLTELGYTFVTVEELFYYKGIEAVNGVEYYGSSSSNGSYYHN